MELPSRSWLGNGSPRAVETDVAGFPLMPLAASTSASVFAESQHPYLRASQRYRWEPHTWKRSFAADKWKLGAKVLETDTWNLYLLI